MGFDRANRINLLLILMKYIILFLFAIVLGLLITGFVLQGQEHPNAAKFIGFGALGLFFVVMPLFIIWRGRGKSVKDYMLTRENLDKMRDKDL